MAIFLKRLILFIPFVIIVYTLGVIAWGYLAPDFFRNNLNFRRGAYGHMFSRAKDVKKIRNIDILFVGASHAYRGFDTRIYKDHGLSAFNLGSSAQSHIQTKYLLKRYLDGLNPKLVVYEVFPTVFSNDGVESSVDLLANDRIDLNSLKMALEINDIRTYNALIFGLFRQVLDLNDDFHEPEKTGDDLYISKGGYVEKKIKYFQNNVMYKKDNRVLGETQLEAFDEALSLLKQKNIPYILVQTPVTLSLYKSILNNDEIDSAFMSRGNYINFNEKVALNDSLHFYDSGHLNQNGVKIFNEQFIKYLNQLPVFAPALKTDTNQNPVISQIKQRQ